MKSTLSPFLHISEDPVGKAFNIVYVRGILGVCIVLCVCGSSPQKEQNKKERDERSTRRHITFEGHVGIFFPSHFLCCFFGSFLSSVRHYNIRFITARRVCESGLHSPVPPFFFISMALLFPLLSSLLLTTQVHIYSTLSLPSNSVSSHCCATGLSDIVISLIVEACSILIFLTKMQDQWTIAIFYCFGCCNE